VKGAEGTIVPRIIGIDEAGYSPLLGPLVISAAAFDVRRQPADWWAALRIPRAGDDARAFATPVVDDSKKVYTPSEGVGRLETAVLAFLRLTGRRPSTLRQLLACVSASPDTQAYPWYAGQDVAIPLAADPAAIERAAEALREALGREEAAFAGFRSSPVLAGDLNDRLRLCGNKATVLLGATLDLARHFVDSPDTAFLIDKQGGRDFYGSLISQYFFGALVKNGVEGNDLSTYAVEHGGRRFDMSFCVGGDGCHLPIALASMLSKYIRELFLELFNRYWRAIKPDLPRTSGYRLDGRRFLDAISSLPEFRRVPREMIVRMK